MKREFLQKKGTWLTADQPPAEFSGGVCEEALAARLARGVCRGFAEQGLTSLVEFHLANGRRADVIALDGRGGLAIVEIKSSLADFRSDGKWPEYRDFCDRFYFAVAAEFPREVLPEDCGLILADAYGAVVEREAPEHPLKPARRKAVTLRFAQAAARRLALQLDPG
jgi:hypothetical protein